MTLRSSLFSLSQAADRNGTQHTKVPQEVPAFEEDQEVERQAMLSSPIKHGKRITSEVRSLTSEFRRVRADSNVAFIIGSCYDRDERDPKREVEEKAC